MMAAGRCGVETWARRATRAAWATTSTPAARRPLEVPAEGTGVQTLHIGSFDDEGPVLARVHQEVVPHPGFTPSGTHHEVYLSDVRRTAPDRLRVILRQPVARA